MNPKPIYFCLFQSVARFLFVGSPHTFGRLIIWMFALCIKPSIQRSPHLFHAICSFWRRPRDLFQFVVLTGCPGRARCLITRSAPIAQPFFCFGPGKKIDLFSVQVHYARPEKRPPCSFRRQRCHRSERRHQNDAILYGNVYDQALEFACGLFGGEGVDRIDDTGKYIAEQIVQISVV